MKPFQASNVIRKLIWGTLMLGCLLACICAGLGIHLFREHLHGKEAWLSWRADRIAKGDCYEWKQLVPPDVPDAENFAMAPLIAGAIRDKKTMDPRFKALEPPDFKEAAGDWRKGQRANLSACAKTYGKQDLPTVLAPFEATLKELDEASRRPQCRLPIRYEDFEILVPYGFRGAARTLRLRALDRLQRGKSDLALQDVLTNLRIAEHLKAEPSLVIALLHAAILGLDMQPIWEGLRDHRWNDAQLAELEKALACVDMLRSGRLAFQGERMGAVVSFTCAAEGKALPSGLRDEKLEKIQRDLGVLGRGFMYRNLLELDRFETSNLIDPLNPDQHRVLPVEPIALWLRRLRYRKDLVLAQIAIPAFSGQMTRIARLQAAIDQARIVCALERFHLAHGTYPATTSELSPNYLAQIPHDLMTGEPLRYRRKGDGFVLYSLGWDQKDDDGVLMDDETLALGETRPRGDWPWVPVSPGH